MAYRCFKLAVTACLLFACMSAVNGLECLTCDDANGKPCSSANVTVCGYSEVHYDSCLKIVTGQQQPNNGPDDSKRDNEVKTYTVKSCATLNTLKPHMVTKLGVCTKDFIGGGGWQVRCVCAGNQCNSADRPVATLTTLVAVSGLLALFH